MTSKGQESCGVVLIVVLWVVAILAVVCLALGGTVRFKHAHLRRKRSELAARQALLSAAALAKQVLLADAAAADTPADNWAGGDPEAFTLVLGGTVARLFSPPGRSGLEDESARLNANTASADMLAKLPGMTVSAADALVAARESIRKAAPGGDVLVPARGLTGPYAGLGQLADALVSAFGEAGLYSPVQGAEPSGGASDGPGSWASQMQLPSPVAQILSYLTVHSRQRNVDAEGRPRTDLNTASRADLAAAVAGHLSEEQIDAIVLSRAAKCFRSIGELLIREMEIADAEGGKKTVRIGRDEFKPVADRLSVTDAEIIPGLVNVNTAPAEVLRCLPGLTEADISAIIARRAAAGPDGGSFASIGWLLDVLSEEAFADVSPVVTTRSQQFRMHAEARPGRMAGILAAGGYSADSAGSVHDVGAYALAILERDAGRCSVLLWLTWTAPFNPDRSGL